MFHHLLDAVSSLSVGDIDEIDSSGLADEVDRGLVACGLKSSDFLSENIKDFDLLEVLA